MLFYHFTKVRTSYLPAEISWGHVFAPVITKKFGGDRVTYFVDHGRFNDIIPIDMEELSAKDKRESIRKSVNSQFRVEDKAA